MVALSIYNSETTEGSMDAGGWEHSDDCYYESVAQQEPEHRCSHCGVEVLACQLHCEACRQWFKRIKPLPMGREPRKCRPQVRSLVANTNYRIMPCQRMQRKS